MEDEAKTRKHLIDELEEMRRRVSALEGRGTGSVGERVRPVLKEDEERYRIAIEHSNDAIAFVTGDVHRYVNRKFIEMFGYERPEEVVNKPLSLVVSPEDGEMVKAFCHNRQEGRPAPARYEFRGIKRDGGSIFIEASATNVVLQGKSHSLAYLRDISDRKRAEESLQRRVDFENLVMVISTHFVNIDSEAVNAGINQALQALGNFLGVDRGQVFLFSRDGRIMDNTHEWCREDVESHIHRLKTIEIEVQFPWFAEHVKQSDIFLVPKVSAMPHEAGAEKEEFLREGIESLIIVPMSCRNTIIGCIWFGSERTETEWCGEDIALFKVIGEIFANALARREAEKALRASEEKYRNIFNNAAEGIFQITAAGRFVNANLSQARIHGYDTPEELVQSVKNILKELYVDPRRHRKMMSLLKKDGIVRNFEAEMYRKDGATNWVSMNIRAIYDEDGQFSRYEGTTEDITERKQTEEALHESEAKYRSVVEESLVGFYIIQNGFFRYVNKRFCEIHGYSHDEMIEKKRHSDFVHPEDKARVEENIRKQIEGEKDCVEYEFRGIRKDGKVITLKTLGTSILYGGWPAASGMIIDISKERILEAQLYHSQKLEAIGQLAGGIAHDFNNILSAIIGYTSLMQLKMRAEDPLRGYTEQILNSSHRAAHLTQSLLAFSRKQIIHLTPCKVNSIIAGVGKLLRRLLTEDIELKTTLSNDDPVILADVTQIDQVLINLATNARDAMPKGGLLAIETIVVDVYMDFAAAHGLEQSGKYALILVSDNGTGISEKTKGRIFEPFFTTKEVGKGTGLGLSIVYGIIQQHNGCIDVYSEPDHGTTFNIYFPLVSRKVEDVTMDLASTERRGSETVLVAEDNAEVRLLVGTILREHGYRTIEAEDGMDAINKFLMHREKISLVILDVVMPRKNGKEVSDAIKKTDPHTPVLFISGYTDDIIHQKGILDENLDSLSKPISPESFLGKVREILDR